ncbi:hypothetical protein CWATWH0401_3530 [Crocosphaera watsonii WH 0401]|uniref:Uncharacterized protein n=1 Tax=Crocosphaera watsonii WH 0401 TaxID=555881 RepID=T2J6S7_CROWT|nr:hypothetical protein CWATWH0401_3530 [Crocosphaera watsonii WH 0401]
MALIKPHHEKRRRRENEAISIKNKKACSEGLSLHYKLFLS